MGALKIYCDGGARGNPGPAAAAFVVFNEKGVVVFKSGRYLNIATNNVAEYTAVLDAAHWVFKNKFSILSVCFFLDSQLVVRQLTGIYKLKNTTLAAIAQEIKSLERRLPGKVFYKHIPRLQNKVADGLVNRVLDELSVDKQ